MRAGDLRRVNREVAESVLCIRPPVDRKLNETMSTDTVVLLTGGTSGIGRIAIQRLAETGATVVTVGRDAEAGRELEQKITAKTPGTVDFRRVDLAEQSNVRELAHAFTRQYDRLDALVHNAGLSSDERRETADGIELSLAVNHLAPYLLTHDLLDLLASTPEARVVVTASSVHRRATLDFDDLQATEGYDALDAYARSKLANVAFTIELADRLSQSTTYDGVVANCVHPGFIPTTGLYRDVGTIAAVFTRLAAVVPWVGTSETEGARRLFDVTTRISYGTVSGQYIGGDGPEEPSSAATDSDVRDRLWRVSADLVDVDQSWP